MTDLTNLTEFRTGFACFTALFTNHGALFTAASARTHHHTIAAVIAFAAPSPIFCTIHAGFTVPAEIVITVITMLCTFRTDHCTLRTAVSTAADIFCTVYTGFTVMAEVAFSAYTVYTCIAASADVFIRTVGTLFITVRTDGSTVRTTFPTVTYSFYTITAVAAV